ncbi:MAG TPA: hypothetical protein VIN71_05400, partial [Pseudomonadales bacterium]
TARALLRQAGETGTQTGSYKHIASPPARFLPGAQECWPVFLLSSITGKMRFVHGICMTIVT